MKKTLIALTLAAVLPLSVHAAERSSTFVETTYVDIDGNIDGLGMRGQVAFADTNFYVLGRYVGLSNRSFDTDFWELGLGYTMNLSSTLDLVTEAAYNDYDAADGYRVSVGVRNSFTPNLEGLLKANYRNADGRLPGLAFGADRLGASAGLHYRFGRTLGVSGEVEFFDGAEIYTLGLRASF